MTSRRSGHVVVEVHGELDLRTSGELRATLTSLADDGHDRIVVDFGGVTFCDAAGLGALVAANNRLAPRGGTLHLVRVGQAQQRILRLTRLDTLFSVSETFDEATQSR